MNPFADLRINLVCTHTASEILFRARMQAHTNTYTCTDTHMHDTHTNAHGHAPTRPPTHPHIHTQTHTHTHTHAHTHTHTHTRTRAHTHTHTQALASSVSESHLGVVSLCPLHLVVVNGDAHDVSTGHGGDGAHGTTHAATAVENLVSRLGAEHSGDARLVCSLRCLPGLVRQLGREVEALAPSPV